MNLACVRQLLRWLIPIAVLVAGSAFGTDRVLIVEEFELADDSKLKVQTLIEPKKITRSVEFPDGAISEAGDLSRQDAIELEREPFKLNTDELQYYQWSKSTITNLQSQIETSSRELSILRDRLDNRLPDWSIWSALGFSVLFGIAGVWFWRRNARPSLEEGRPS